MENIFDHNPTQPELVQLLATVHTREEFESLDLGEDGNLAMLFRLYMIRGEETKARKYLDSMADDEHRFQVQYNDIIP